MVLFKVRIKIKKPNKQRRLRAIFFFYGEFFTIYCLLTY